MVRAGRPLLLSFAVLWGACSGAPETADYPSPPAPSFEFRAAWIATVANIDWPSEPGLSADDQRAELRALLDRAAALRLNAVVLQVRPAADAFYVSSYEPWSEYLTGRMGLAPFPFYDPLEFAVEEAHRRGLELHAWFNPFRAHHPTGDSVFTDLHISRKRPDLTVAYNGYLWLDPGHPDARTHSLDVIMDVVRRYDIDGVHMDDYFYPYDYRDSTDTLVPFPDTLSQALYYRPLVDSTGILREAPVTAGVTDRAPDLPTPADTLTVAGWRRSNIDTFVAGLYNEIKAAKPEVKFGLSPFGIWRPGHPEQIRGFDAYDRLFADSRKWIQEGWVDYLTPQLYWPIDQEPQSYPVLLAWWRDQNLKGRHIWPGNFTSRVISEDRTAWEAQEVVDQILVTRSQIAAERGDVLPAPGNVHFSMKALMKRPQDMGPALARGPYRRPALIPPSPWLDERRPLPPDLSAEWLNDRLVVETRPAGEPAFRWYIRVRRGQHWEEMMVPGWRQSFDVPAGETAPSEVLVNTVGRTGQMSGTAYLAAPLRPVGNRDRDRRRNR